MVWSRDAKLRAFQTLVEGASGVARHPGSEVVQHGRLLKDYVEVPDPVLEDDVELKRLFDASLTHARTLKPKATTKKRQS